MQLETRAAPRGRGEIGSAASSAYRSGRTRAVLLLPARCQRTTTAGRAATRDRTASFSRCSRVRTRGGGAERASADPQPSAAIARLEPNLNAFGPVERALSGCEVTPPPPPTSEKNALLSFERSAFGLHPRSGAGN